MKMRGMWVAWIAALALTAMLAATPREGAATPRKVPMEPGPTFGEPDLPGGRPQQIQPEGFWLRLDWLRFWVRPAPKVTVETGAARREGPMRDWRATR